MLGGLLHGEHAACVAFPGRDASVFRVNLPSAPPPPHSSLFFPLSLLLYSPALSIFHFSSFCFPSALSPSFSFLQGKPFFPSDHPLAPFPLWFRGIVLERRDLPRRQDGGVVKLPLASLFSPQCAWAWHLRDPNPHWARGGCHGAALWRNLAGGIESTKPLASVRRSHSSQPCNCFHPHSSDLRFGDGFYPCRNKRKGAIARVRTRS